MSRRPFLNVVSLVKDTIFHKIKEFYKNDVFSSNTFKSLSKKSKNLKIIDKFFAYALDADISDYKSRFVFLRWRIIRIRSSMIVTIIIFHVIQGFRDYMRQSRNIFVGHD